ncbi:MAG: AMP-binding protein, partial [Myxococcota bacterium]|nr:AMP-binding protein [Myxococcota bacterium]
MRAMGELARALDAWRRRREAFRWEVPPHFHFGRDVVDRFAEDPARPALLWRSPHGEEDRWTFARVRDASDRLAALLADLGVTPGQPVVVMLPKIPAWHVAMVAALKAGALVVPSSTILRPKDLLYRLEHSAAVAVLAGPDEASTVDEAARRAGALAHRILLRPPGSRAALPAGWVDGDAAPERDAPAPATRAEDPALVYYTSGTTGPPKAVLHDHAYTFAQRQTASEWLGLRGDDRIWTTSDTGWAKAAYSVLFGPWSLGAEVFLYAGRFEARRELELLSEVKPDVFCAPPTEYRLLVKEDLGRLLRHPGLRECVSAGEPLNPEVIRAWREATGLTIRDGYGQTE